MDTVKLKIDGVEVEAQKGMTILEAAASVGIEIPALCFLKDCNKVGACRMCVVSVAGVKKPVAACVYPVAEGMEVQTETPEVIESRKKTLDLMCKNHRMDCEYCPRYTDCELHAMMRRYGIDERIYSRVYKAPEVDVRDAAITYDRSKCILCRRCVGACKAQNMNILQVYGRGVDAHIGMNTSLDRTSCIHCGQCISVCPTGALSDPDNLHIVLHDLEDHSKYMVAIVAPEVCRQIGELFAEQIGNDDTGKVASMLHKLGFKKVISTEEGKKLAARELAEEICRHAESGTPLITGDCPSWTVYCRRNPELKKNLSSCPDPRILLSEACRKEFADEADGRYVNVVSFEPCTSARYAEGGEGADLAMTTREMAALIKRSCVSRYTAVHTWRSLEGEEPDKLTEEVSSMPYVPSNDGSIILSALSYAGAEKLSDNIYSVNGKEIKVAMVSGIGSAKAALSSGEHYDVISVMACPGGCINGGGQPHTHGSVRNFTDVAAARLGNA